MLQFFLGGAWLGSLARWHVLGGGPWESGEGAMEAGV